MTYKPYQGTIVTATRSQNQIQEYLLKHGIATVQWTTHQDERGGMIIRLQFFRRNPGGNNGHLFRLDLPIAKEKERNRLMRLFFHFLKSKLEAIDAGLREFNEEFLAYLVLPGYDETVYNRGGHQLMTAAENAGMFDFNKLKALPKGRE